MTNLEQMVAEANAVVAEIDVAAAQRMIAEQDALLLDVREPGELERKGVARGAHHVARGTLEFVIDPDSPAFDPRFRFDRPVILYCAVGARAVLAGKVLKDMGYEHVYSISSLKKWAEGGGAVDSWPPS